MGDFFKHYRERVITNLLEKLSMLQDLRDQKNSWLIIVLFAAIIVVFIFMFGLPSMDSVKSNGSSTDLVNVGSHSVNNEMLRSMIYQHYDDNVFSSPDYASFARSVAQGIGVVYLLADAARDAGLRVSDDELNDYIRDWQYGNEDIFKLGFLHKNKFSQRNYSEALSRYGMSTRDYENYKREELLARRYMLLMASSISVSDETLWQSYARDNASATIEVVQLTADAVRATFKPLSEEEITAFETVGAEDIKNYYNEHLGDYTTPPKAKLHQIVIQKNFSKLTNPGAQTSKTMQAEGRFNIAKAQVFDKNLDFAQAFTDYDESEDKELKGVSGLLDVGIMAKEIQTALEGKKVGDLFTAELSDRYVIGKVLEQTEKNVTPLDDVKHSIAQKILDDRRIQNRTDEVMTGIIGLVNQGKTLEEALNSTLYANVLAEQPMAPVGAVDENAANQADAAADGSAADSAEAQLVPIPTELPIVPESSRVRASTVQDVPTNSNFVLGVGVSDDLARDIRGAASGTMLSKSYKVGQDTFVVRVVEKKEASRDAFNVVAKSMREEALAEKTLELVGAFDGVLNFRGPYGLWVQQKIEEASAKGTLKINEDFFNREHAKRMKAKQEREERAKQ